MPLVTVSSKHQITLPADFVRALGVNAGDKLAMELLDGRIVAVPEPASWVTYLQGSARGVYGSTKPAVDRYVAQERATWGAKVPDAEPSTPDDFADYYVAHRGQAVQQVVDDLVRRPYHAGPANEIGAEVGLGLDQVAQILDGELVSRGWVRRIAAEHGTVYRLRREMAQAIGAD
jgi:bifunctional DNA-binding transcriptional regulator/antitoxin component of YhaV-PrlF toxin-antitoxin module